ncbi:MAG: hypothetical protein MUE74_02975 [Bacteroidales bacterium]|jgi:tetratricopeptide (TPR) repeat protein|nr:hypothetical protein [Bacteroidales bacterium]
MLKELFFSTFVFLLMVLTEGRLYASDYFAHALRIYSEGRYFEASIEFERAIFYEADNHKIAYFRYYKSLCYKNMTEYSRALNELADIDILAVPDSLLFPVFYEKAICSFLAGDEKSAFLEIEKIRKIDTAFLFAGELLPLEILCLNTAGRWDNARAQWYVYLECMFRNDSLRNVFMAEVEAIYCKKNIPKFHSTMKAGKLSGFIPGLGQIYCGEILEGTLNFLINVTLLGFTIWELYTKYYFTGYIMGLRLFNRFYTSGIRRAVELAREKNTEVINKFNAANSELMFRAMNYL